METRIEKKNTPAKTFEYESAIAGKLDLINQHQRKIRSLSENVRDLIALCSISENRSRLQLLQKQLTFLYIKLSIAASDLHDLSGACSKGANNVALQELSRIEGVLNEFLQFYRFTSMALQRLVFHMTR